ncbi:MAG: polysaccharide deacetylase family protein [Bacteroidales bacterium]|jgi:hypothetical protein|nr:polysaccharide deacetylase family protein [Bacteroidales bacterium]
MNKITLYCVSVNPRLDYAARYIFENLMGLSLRWTSSEEEFSAAGNTAKILLQNGTSAVVSGLLDNRTNAAVSEAPSLYVDNWILYPSDEIISADELENKWQNVMFPAPPIADSMRLLDFDIFSAIFFLLSRYEEYRAKTPHDNYGRFPATSSYLYKTDTLQKPVINIWASILREKLQHIYPALKFTLPPFEIFPTIDIDHGFLVKNKPFYKQLGGLVKHPEQFNTRLSVLLGLRQDPYFNVESIVKLHRSLGLKSKLFFHCADYKNGIDNANTLPSKKYVELLKNYKEMEDVEVGLHLSYNAALSNNSTLAQNEKSLLENFASNKIYSNRCHFLMFTLPQTYQMIEHLGIIDDYTMGYADQPGFRAGCCTPFHWYDLAAERKTSLKIFPLTCMDATFSRYLHCTWDEAFEKMTELREKVRIMNGVFIPLFHNETFALGDKKLFQLYENLLSE